MKIWGRATSSNVQAVMWCIGELGLDHERIDCGHRYGGLDTPAFRAMNPNGTIPVLEMPGGPIVWESCAILRYLGSRYARAPFWPDDPDARAPVDQWAEWAKINVAVPFSGGIFFPLVRLTAAQRDEKAIAAAISGLRPRLDIAEAALARHDHLAGADFTLADIVFGHVLYRYFGLEVERPDHPRIRAYYDRLTERPAYREHVMVPYDELRAS